MPLVWLRFAFGCAFQQRFRILLFALRQQYDQATKSTLSFRRMFIFGEFEGFV
jgi:hypothetical protein